MPGQASLRPATTTHTSLLQAAPRWTRGSVRWPIFWPSCRRRTSAREPEMADATPRPHEPPIDEAVDELGFQRKAQEIAAKARSTSRAFVRSELQPLAPDGEKQQGNAMPWALPCVRMKVHTP